MMPNLVLLIDCHRASPNAPYCATHHFENGFTAYFCTVSTTALIDTVFLVSAGETTTRAGLVRLTGSNGPGTVSTTLASTVIVRETETVTAVASPGVIAGSVIGGAAAGALVTLLVVVLLWFRRQKRARAKGTMQDEDTVAAFETAAQGPGAMSSNTQSQYDTRRVGDASGWHELHGSTGPRQIRPELPGRPH